MTGHYEDLIGLPHHISKKHPQMAVSDRAAQFSPFAALTGYDDTLKETARQTDRRIILSDDEKAALNDRLQIVLKQGSQSPIVSITYFVPDKTKDGGTYATLTGSVKKFEECNRTLRMLDGTQIPVEEILHIE